MLNVKDTIIRLSDGQIKQITFSKTKIFRGNEKVELDLSNYPAKADLKNGTGFDTSDLIKKY